MQKMPVAISCTDSMRNVSNRTWNSDETGPQQYAVEFALDDVVVPEFVEVQADDVEEAVGNQREAVEKQHLFETPAADLRNFLEQHDDEAERENRGGEAGGQADEKIAAIADAHFGVLREIIGEEQRVPLRASQNSGQASGLVRLTGPPSRPANRVICSCEDIFGFSSAVDRDFFATRDSTTDAPAAAARSPRTIECPACAAPSA